MREVTGLRSSLCRQPNRKERAMSRRLALGCLLLGLMGSPAPAQTPIHRDLIPTRSALARVGLERHWMALVPIIGTERLLEISIADNLLFAQTSLGNFYAYEAE